MTQPVQKDRKFEGNCIKNNRKVLFLALFLLWIEKKLLYLQRDKLIYGQRE